MTLVLWTAGDPAAVAAPVRAAGRGIDPEMPISGLAAMGDLVARSVAQPRFVLSLLAVFALAALALAAIGVYGIVSYGVTQRTAEIGLRVALGADRRDVIRLVVGGGLRLALAGTALGVVGALAVTRAMATLLFGVTATDPVTFAATAAALAVVAGLASLAPAFRATRIDPVEALRAE
jgi:putative ABC transport system permease protein